MNIHKTQISKSELIEKEKAAFYKEHTNWKKQISKKHHLGLDQQLTIEHNVYEESKMYLFAIPR